ncbi:MAG: hypothetical protein KTR14_06095, partial [Vampirovibrio sp.]|nr:hypothetical protein [Vampirovibrio sp.]
VLSPKENVKIFQRLIQDQDSESIYYKLVCLNAGAALLIAGKAEDLKSGMVMAGDLLQYGEVYKTVKKCRKAYKTFGVKNPKQKAKAWWNPTP